MNLLLPARIAVAGAGMIGQAHIAVIRASPDCVLSAIVDPSPAAAGLASKAEMRPPPTRQRRSRTRRFAAISLADYYRILLSREETRADSGASGANARNR